MNKKKGKPILRLFSYTLKHPLCFVLLVFSALIATACSLGSVILIGRAIDKITELKKVLRICAMIGVLTLGYFVFEWLTETLASKITYLAVRDIKKQAFGNLLKAKVGFIDGMKSGDLISTMVVDIAEISDGLLLCFTQLFTGVFTVLGTIVIMMIMNYKIGLIVVCITPLSLISATFISKGTHKYFKLQSNLRGEVSSKVKQATNSAEVYKIFNYQTRAENNFDKTNKELEKASVKAVFFSSLPNPTTRFVNNVIYALTCLIGALSIINGGAFSLTVGTLTVFLTYAQKYAKPFNEISDVFTELESASASFEKVSRILDCDKEEEDGVNAVELTDGSKRIEFKNVSFSYVPDKPLIENLNVTADRGNTVAIVGRTGSGKSTLINLLMRFYDVNGGDIYMDGIDVKDIKRSSLRSSFGMVLQDSFVFSGTVRDNVAFGRKASDEEIWQAIEQAQATGFVKRLSDGLDTYIGENVNLSEGQKQLICIARAMLYIPDMIILDEATSFVDVRTEVKIRESFDKMAKGRTSFIVAHRLSTIENADLILVMDKGQIVEKGTHEELIKENGLYTELYTSSFSHA